MQESPSTLGVERKGYEGKALYIRTEVGLYESLYQVYPVLRAMVDKIARVASLLDFEIIPARHIEEEGATPDKTQRLLLQNFFRTPNEQESFTQLMFWMVARLVLLHECFLEVTYSADGLPVDFYSLAGTIQVLQDEHGNLLSPAYRQFLGGRTADFESYEVIRFVQPDALDSSVPSSVIDSLGRTIAIDSRKIDWLLELVKQGGYGRKRLVWILKGGTGDEKVYERNKEEIKSEYGGLKSASADPVVIEGEVTVAPYGETISEADYNAGRKSHREEIGGVMGVPLPKLGDFEAMGKATMDEINKEFLEETIQPVLRLIENGFNHFIERQWGIKDWQFRFEFFKPHEYRDVARAVQVMGKMGWISQNEARRWFRLPARPNGDKLILIHDRFGVISLANIEKESERINAMVGRSIAGAKLPIEEEELEQKKAAPTSKIEKEFYKNLRSMLDKAEEELQEFLAQKWEEQLTGTKLQELPPEDFIDETIEHLHLPNFSKELFEAMKRAMQLGRERETDLLKLKAVFKRLPKEAIEALKERAFELAESTLRDIINGEPESGRLGIKKLLLKGLEEGWTASEVQKRVGKFFDAVKDWKAARIVRTEIPKAYEKGKIDVSKDAGVTKATISLGWNPCEVCREFYESIPEDGLPIAEVEEFFRNHHPNVDCTFVPIYEGERVEG